MNTRQDYIGVFDSGVGGLSVLRHLRRLMPGEKFVYFGDSANAPYGIKTRQQVKDLSFAAAVHLMQYGLKALVVACNTATAAAIDELRKAYPDLIIVGVEPALKLAAERYPGEGIGVMATPVTLGQDKFNALVSRYQDKCRIFKIPAPSLVKIVEAGQVDTPATVQMLDEIFSPYRGKLKAVVLGCTHYPFASHTIARFLGEGVDVLDGGPGTANQTLHRLEAADLLEKGKGELIVENSLGTPEIMKLSWELINR